MGPTSLCCPHHVRWVITLSNGYFLLSPLLPCSSFSSFFFFFSNSPFSSFFFFSSLQMHTTAAHRPSKAAHTCSSSPPLTSGGPKEKIKIWAWFWFVVWFGFGDWKMEFNLGLVFLKKIFCSGFWCFFQNGIWFGFGVSKENIFVLGFGVHPQMYRNGFVRVEFMYVLYRMVGMSQVTVRH